MKRFVVFTGCQVHKELFDILKADLEVSPLLFMESELTIINTPFIFDSKEEAIEAINIAFKDMTTILLLDIIESKIKIYKGDRLFEKDSLYLSRFLTIYNIMFNENITLIKHIEDFRSRKEIFKTQLN